VTDVTRFQRSKPPWLATANFNRSSMFSSWLLVGLLAHSAPLPVRGGCRIGTRWPRQRLRRRTCRCASPSLRHSARDGSRWGADVITLHAARPTRFWSLIGSSVPPTHDPPDLGHSSWQVRPRRSTWCRWAPCRRPPRPSANTQHLIRSRGALRSKRVVIGPGIVSKLTEVTTPNWPRPYRAAAQKSSGSRSATRSGGRQGRGRRSRDRSTSGTAPHRTSRSPTARPTRPRPAMPSCSATSVGYTAWA
jgi:hypothetical protein